MRGAAVAMSAMDRDDGRWRGGRTFDFVHVDCALVLGARQFVTFNTKQGLVARQAGLDVLELSSSEAQP